MSRASHSSSGDRRRVVSCRDRAIGQVLECADALEKEARSIAIMRSVDATESSKWLSEVVEALRGSVRDATEEGDTWRELI